METRGALPILADPSWSSTDHVQHSVTVSTSSRPFSSFAGTFNLTLHPIDGQPVAYDFPLGRFPRGSTVRFHIAVPDRLSIARVSIRAGYILGLARWRINFIRIAPHHLPSHELVSGACIIPGHNDLPLEIPLAPLSHPPHLGAGGSAILHIWLPSWSLALRRKCPRRDLDIKCLSSVSSSATLIPSEQDLRSLDDWCKSTEQSSSAPPSVEPPHPSRSLAPLIPSTPRYASWGHASLSLFPSSGPSSATPSSYISVWPSELSSSLSLPKLYHHIRKLYCKATWSPSLACDIIEEGGRAPDIELHIQGVDADRVQRWADAERKRARGYTPWSWNCAEVVWAAICVGLEHEGGAEYEEGEAGRRRNPAGSAFHTKVRSWEMEPFIRDLATRRADKVAEGVPGRIAEWTGTKVPADLEILVERMRAEGYGEC